MKRYLLRDIFKRRTTLLWISALIITLASFVEYTSAGMMDREMRRLENRIHKREKILEKFAKRTIDLPDDEFVNFGSELPEDMTIYRYFDDTLQSWTNQLLIFNDEIRFFPFGYILNHVNGRVVTYTPLAYLNYSTDSEQYVNLGSAWYIIKIYTKGRQKVISALLVQTDYPSENSILKNKVNPNFSLNRRLSIVPVIFDESYIVRSKNGGVLFSVIKTLPGNTTTGGTILRWIAALFTIAALFSGLYKKRGFKEFLFMTAGLILLRFLALYQSKEMQGEYPIFSPNLYADFGLFNSLADLLINNILIFFFITALFIIRRKIAAYIFRQKRIIRSLLAAIFLTVPLLLIYYIHFSIRSLIMNSNIVMELFKIDEISIYTLIVYVSYGLLFVALLFSLQLLRPFLARARRISFFSKRALIIYLTLISLYTLLTVSIYGYSKEFNRNRVWTTKMSIERDLNLELQLRELEKFIEYDQHLALAVGYSQNFNLVNRIFHE